MIPTTEKIAQLALCFIPNIGCVQAKHLVTACGSAGAVFTTGKKDLLRIHGMGPGRVSEILSGKALVKAEKEWKALKRRNIEFIYFTDAAYPDRLRHYPDSPIVLFKKGRIQLNARRHVAIIGTRKPSAYGEKMCYRMVEGMAEMSPVIYSGLAHGIDTFAHRAALRYGLPTVGVLGSGLDWIYPSVNRNLASGICKEGGLLSEFPLGTKPDRENFPMRNRIIAAIADVLIVIESARKGGSMITVEYANNYNKDVFAIPGRTTDILSEGCNHIIKAHKAQLCSSADDISYIMRWEKSVSAGQMELHLELGPDEKKVFELIQLHKEIGLDSLHYNSSLSLSSLNSILLNLEFKGLVKTIPGKKYILI